ncbi:DUF1656 domain-containing protein [Cupriavidus necator]|uniref:DUF1656 domain-containing protein n=1 Tax=Cupriavidus necator TaxID=106590 RepID=UPI0039C363A3
MMTEVDFYGVFIPAVLVLMVLAFFLTAGLRHLLANAGFYKYVWHRSLFNLLLYVIVFGILAAFVSGFPS